MTAHNTPPAAPRAFIHHPRPAIVPALPGNWQKRIFGIATPVAPLYGVSSASVSVYRLANSDVGTLCIEIENARIDFRASASPSNLRAIAAQLIDAAHDIEANPAHTLVQPLSLLATQGGAA